MSDKSNIIYFPKEKLINESFVDEEYLSSNVLEVKINHINELLSVIVPILFNNIENGCFPNFDVNEDSDIKDVNLVVESIRSLICKYYNISHPFQELSENLFEKELETGEYVLSKKLDFEFNTDKIGEDINIQ